SRRRRPRYGLATGLLHRGSTWAPRVRDAVVDPGDAAVADDPRLSRSGPRHRRRDRTFGARAASNGSGFCKNQAEDARSHATVGSGAYVVHALSPALAGRIDADGRAGVLLQRHLLHLRA